MASHSSRNPSSWFWKCLLVSTACFSPHAVGQESETAEKEKALMKRWYAVYDNLAKSFQIEYVDKPKGAPQLEFQAVLTLYAPVTGAKQSGGVRHGRVYLWTDAHRPVVVGSIFSASSQAHLNRNVAYEFHSLSQTSVVARKDDATLWRCQISGVEWNKRTDVAAPSESRVARLVQMREIARNYTTEGGGGGQHRLLTQPIYRYPESTTGVIDGAIFAYAHTTDPQVFLLIETRHRDWFVAFARSTVVPLEVRQDGKLIWSCERKLEPFAQNEPFFISFAAEGRSAEDPDRILFKRSFKD
jgi:hypothetical protein